MGWPWCVSRLWCSEAVGVVVVVVVVRMCACEDRDAGTESCKWDVLVGSNFVGCLRPTLQSEITYCTPA